MQEEKMQRGWLEASARGKEAFGDKKERDPEIHKDECHNKA